jgi:hypothetical protein
MNTSGKITLIAVLLFLFAGCLKIDDLPPEPTIEFVSFEQFNDSASLVFSFKDGDGDIGLSDGDTTGAYAPGETFHHNLFIDYFELQNGVWEEVTLLLPYRYRIPVITPTGQNKLLDGEIAVALAPFPTIFNGQYDTVKYSVQLADRALNVSNVVETGPIVLE